MQEGRRIEENEPAKRSPVTGDPLPATIGDAVRGLRGVVALMLAEQHDLSKRGMSATRIDAGT